MNDYYPPTYTRAITIFAPLALAVLVLISTLYISTREAPVKPSPSPSAIAATVEDDDDKPPTELDYTRHIEQLRKRVPGKEFTILVEAPFVVIGDSAPSAVRSQAETVRWAVEKLKLAYFEKDPQEILDIWLFKDAASYRKHALQLFNDQPTTPYGYYSSTHKALIMNIETGGGTLVHEIVHPFIEANFPDCPPWLNEGLGSLYEQSGEEKGQIWGYTNWRLPGLQRAINDGAVPSFKALTDMNAQAFYYEDKGTNYGQSRYLCYYLQKRGLLAKFYKEFYTNRKTDPTGYNTLQKILGERDMDAFKKRWERFVLGLRQGFEVEVSGGSEE